MVVSLPAYETRTGYVSLPRLATRVTFSGGKTYLFLTKAAWRAILAQDRLYTRPPNPFVRIDKVKSRAPKTGVLLLILLLLLLTAGCGSKLLPLLHRDAAAGSLPERISQQPKENTYRNARVGVFRFAEPPQQTDVGYNAASSLYQALAGHTIFHAVMPELGSQGPDLAAQLQTARNKGYDLIIRGSVDYYLDGTLYQESRVDVTVTAYDVNTAAIVWHAVATASSRPQTGKDYYLYKSKGKRPLPPAALIEMNTRKFINMFAQTPANR
jgi:hypothetical protein